MLRLIKSIGGFVYRPVQCIHCINKQFSAGKILIFEQMYCKNVCTLISSKLNKLNTLIVADMNITGASKIIKTRN